MSALLSPPVAPQALAVLHQGRRLARTSAQAPWLHQEAARRLAAKLEPIRLQPTTWLDWGAFLGGGAALVQARYPSAQRWAVEPLPELLARSQEQACGAARPWWSLKRRPVEPVWLAGSDEAPPWPAGGVDLLWANMTLHAHSDLAALFTRWHQALAVDGFLMCSGLGPDTARELRGLYKALDWPLPTIDFVDMHDLGDAMVQAGFADPVMDMERITLTWGHAEDLLSELRSWGGNVAMGRHPGLRTPRWRQRLIDELNRVLRRPDGRLGLTVELVYGHAIKPAPRHKVAPQTHVSLADMRAMIKQGGTSPRD